MPPNTQPVCDNCRLRKTKCDRALPCSTCITCNLPCQYRHNLQRRGPKGGKGRRLAMIRHGLDSGGGVVDTGQVSQSGELVAYANTNVCDDASFSQPTASNGCYEEEKVLAAHVSIFMTQLFPVLPVVDEAQLRADCALLNTLTPLRYALLLSLAAVTRIQMRLDRPEEVFLDDTLEQHQYAAVSNTKTGDEFVREAEAARQKVNLAETMSEDAILTSFFLFVCYGNQEKHKQAWFYLNQSVAMAVLLQLDHETPESVAGLTDSEIDRRRRIFWLLFISERTYALQRRMPVLLRRTVPKPRVFDSDYPIIMNDFVNHVNLFESLPPALYDWQPQNTSDSNLAGLSQSIMQALCAVQPHNSVLESQQFDTLITQHWLRVTMWRLVRGIAPGIAQTCAASEIGLPFDAGRSIMLSLASVSTSSKNRHGISLEQKLFDIGMSLVDVAPATGATAMTLGPQDLLGAIVGTLSCIRGQRSHLLPKLLEHSKMRLDGAKMGWGKDMQLSTDFSLGGSQERHFEELLADFDSCFEDENAVVTELGTGEFDTSFAADDVITELQSAYI